MRSRIPLRVTTRRFIFGATVLCGTCVSTGAGSEDLVETFDVESYDVERLREAADAGRPFLLDYFGDTHTIRVTPNQVRSERFTMTSVTLDGFRPMIPARTQVYKGGVVDDTGSIVRLMIDERGLRGYIKSSDGWTFIEPLDRDSKVARAHDSSNISHRVFGEQDLADSVVGTCGDAHELTDTQIEESSLQEARVHIEDGTASPKIVELAAPPQAERLETDDPIPTQTGQLGTMEVAVVADFEFFEIHGANSLAEIEAAINAVDGIYESELGIGVEIVDVTIWQDAADPYEQVDSLALLNELRAHWNVNGTAVARDVVHLFTGKELDGSTVGIAFVSVVCNLGNAYSLSQDLQSDYLEGALIAHELGHTLGAQHDEVGTTPRYIMYPSIGGSTIYQFGAVSAAAIASYANGVSCLEVDGAEQSGEGTGGGAGGGGGGGGGGGPVDPTALIVVGLGLGAEALRRRRARAR